MAHFDAKDILQAKALGQTVTIEQPETLDRCKLMQSLLIESRSRIVVSAILLHPMVFK